MWSTHSRRIDPINLSAKPFYQGEPGAMGLSRGSSAVELISITDQIARSLIPRECLRDLVGNPVRGRMRCDIDPDKKVRVGCPEAISAGLLSAVIDRFSRQYPRAIVNVTPADNMSLEFRQLRDRRVDFLLGWVPTPLTDEDLQAEVLYQDRLFIVSGRNSRCARRRKFNQHCSDSP